MSLEVAIARLEEKQDAQTEMIREFIASQKIHNVNFYATQREVDQMQAKAKGAWWMLGILGIMVSTAVSWVVTAVFK